MNNHFDVQQKGVTALNYPKRKTKLPRLSSITCKCGRTISANKNFCKSCAVAYTDKILAFMKDHPLPEE